MPQLLEDTKDIFKAPEKARAIQRRYGKQVKISIAYSHVGDTLSTLDDLKILQLTITSNHGKRYLLTEHFKDGNTDYVIFEHTTNGRQVRNKFSRFLDAEVSLIDKISEED